MRGVIILLELLNRYYLSVSSCVGLKMFQNFALLNFIPKTFQFLFLVTCFNPYSSYYSSITELRGKSTNKRVEWGWSVENMWHGGERRCDNLLSTIVGDTSLHLYICICSHSREIGSRDFLFQIIRSLEMTSHCYFDKWRRSVGMYMLYDTRSRKWTKFFLVKHWGPKPPGNPSELIFALFGGLWGPFFKKT